MTSNDLRNDAPRSPQGEPVGDSPACPHGISLDHFCRYLHLSSQPHRQAPDTDPACPHGVPLERFCRELHDTNH